MKKLLLALLVITIINVHNGLVDYVDDKGDLYKGVYVEDFIDVVFDLDVEEGK